MNLFSGKLQTAELFPYPEPLDAEQKEYAKALVDPVHKFYTVSVLVRECIHAAMMFIAFYITL